MTLRTTKIGHACFCDIACSFEDLIHLETMAGIKPSFNWGRKQTIAFVRVLWGMERYTVKVP